jgi:hypothetical protein
MTSSDMASSPIDDTIKAGSEAVANLGRATPAQFNQIISLCLLASVIALAAYEFTLGRPELIKEMKAGHDQGRQEFKQINDNNLQHFESIIEKQDKNHERVVEMITGLRVKSASTGTNSIQGTN